MFWNECYKSALISSEILHGLVSSTTLRILRPIKLKNLDSSHPAMDFCRFENFYEVQVTYAPLDSLSFSLKNLGKRFTTNIKSKMRNSKNFFSRSLNSSRKQRIFPSIKLSSRTEFVPFLKFANL